MTWAGPWEIALDAWVIQDGNYDDFAAGQVAEFAVEFYPPGALEPVADTPPRARSLGEARYDVTANVSIVLPEFWVIDFGLRAFSENEAPVDAGRTRAGEISLGIDPFFYFKRLTMLPAAPALIYRWRIEAISLQTAPFIDDGLGPLKRDPSKLGWRRVSRTDAWHDDELNASYILSCRLLGQAPQHVRSQT